MRKNLHRLLIPALFLLGACAPVVMAPQGSGVEILQETERQQELVYKTIVEDEDRVIDVAFPLLAANTAFCGKRTTPSFGMTAWNRPIVREEYQRAASSLYNLHNILAVQHVAGKSPAARAGIRSGDLILAINGVEIPRGYKARRVAYENLDLAEYRPTNILLKRGEKTFDAVVQPVEICDYPVGVDVSDGSVNAHADGDSIVVARGMMRAVRNDRELALVIAHELGHNAMGHINKKMGNAVIGNLGGMLIDALLASNGVSSGGEFGQLGQTLGGEAYSVQFEQEADYVGMYFMERAGYNSAHVADFWRRMALDMPASVTLSRTHPTTPERFIAIDRTHQEIARKKASGQKLVPNFKEK